MRSYARELINLKQQTAPSQVDSKRVCVLWVVEGCLIFRDENAEPTATIHSHIITHQYNDTPP